MTWSQARLDWLTSVSREVIDPRMLGDEEVVHYSIPALDTLGGPAVEPASSIASTKLRVRGGEVLVSKLNPRKLRVVTVQQHGRPSMASGEFISLIPKSIDARFLSYWLRSEKTRQDLHGATQSVTRSHQRVTPDILTKKWLMVPSLAEQRAIAGYLDTETARIDALIAKKRRLAEALEDRFQTRLSTAIWQSPSERVRLKYLCGLPTSGNRDHQSFTDNDEGVPCLRGLNIRAGRVQRDDLRFISLEAHQAQSATRLRVGDVVVVRSGLAGSAAAVPDDLDDCNCVDLVVIRRTPAVHPRWLEYVLNSREAQEQVALRQAGAILTHFNAIDAGNIEVPAHDLATQNVVVEHLDAERSRRDHVSAKLNLQIELLQEHRQALISAAVTGELEVPGVAA